MKTNYSRQDIDKFAASLEARGWSKTDGDGIQTYSSPVTVTGAWINVTIYGRKVRTVRSYSRETLHGLVDARIAAMHI
jgi:hypothetical protein